MKIKRAIFILIMMVLTMQLFAGDFEDQVRELVKESSPDIYNRMKVRAIDEWKDDHEMILYTITEQCNSFFYVLQGISSENITIIVNSILDWSYDQETLAKNLDLMNLEIDREKGTFSADWILELDVDWTMMAYTLKQQIEAREKY